MKTRRFHIYHRRISGVSLVLLLLVWLIALLSFAQNRPDIEVTQPITLTPESAEQGETVIIRAMITNTETVPVDASFEVKFQIIRNDQGEIRDLTAEEVVCLNSPSGEDPTRCVVPRLSAVGQSGDTFEVRAQLNTIALSPAEYTVRAVADPENTVSETNENNNTGEGFLSILPRRPNLSILAAFRLEPPTPRQGDILTVEFTVENDRPATLVAPIPISIALRNLALRVQGQTEFLELRPPAIRCPDLIIIDERCTIAEGLSADSRRTIQMQLVTALLDPGDYQLRITVDPAEDGVGLINEADETDNVLTIEFKLGQPPRNLTVGEGRVLPQTALPGSFIMLSFTVSNPSPTAVDGVELELSLRRDETGDLSDLRGLPDFACGAREAFQPGQDQCATLRLEAGSALAIIVQFTTGGLPLGSYEAIITVDPQNRVEETDELDNTLRLPFSLEEKPVAQAGPELHPIGIRFTPNSPVVQGQQVLVNATIENSGNRDADAFRVEFAIGREDGGSVAAFAAFGAQPVSELRLGKTVEVQSVLDTAELDPGVYAVRVMITGVEQAELDRNNNTLIAFITITESPE